MARFTTGSSESVCCLRYVARSDCHMPETTRVYISQRCQQLHCIGYHERRTRPNTHQMFRCLGHVWTRIFPYRGGNESLALCGTSWSYMECNIMNHVLCQEKQATAQLVLVASDAGSHGHCAKQPSLNASLFTLTHFSDTCVYQLISRSAYCKISLHTANPRSSRGGRNNILTVDLHTGLTVNSSLKDFSEERRVTANWNWTTVAVRIQIRNH
jgi:hypothetical protein